MHRPQGKGVLPWEANLLKVRALEMVVVLFYVQELRECIIGTFEGTDAMWGRPNRLLAGEKGAREGKKLERARKILVDEHVIDAAESAELEKLMRYRNNIAHAVESLTGDVGGRGDLAMHVKDYLPYDYTAVKRAKALLCKIQDGMRGRYVQTVGLSSLAFEAAERVYMAEVKRLKRRVNTAVAKANAEIALTNAIIRAIPATVIDAADPLRPTHQRENGSLTAGGARCAAMLFDAGANPLAVAHLMRISLRSARHWSRRCGPTRALG